MNSDRTPSGSHMARDALICAHLQVNAAGCNIWVFTQAGSDFSRYFTRNETGKAQLERKLIVI